MTEIEDFLRAYQQQLSRTLEALPIAEIAALIALIDEGRMRGARVYMFGNGGSAATATHFACDLAKGAIVPSVPRIRAWCLTDGAALLTAWSNDSSYEQAIGEVLSTQAESGDIAIAISSSGRSPNVLHAVRAAQEQGLRTVGLTGYEGGELKGMVELPVHVDSSVLEHVEDLHDVIHHMVTAGLRVRHEGDR